MNDSIEKMLEAAEKKEQEIQKTLDNPVASIHFKIFAITLLSDIILFTFKLKQRNSSEKELSDNEIIEFLTQEIELSNIFIDFISQT